MAIFGKKKRAATPEPQDLGIEPLDDEIQDTSADDAFDFDAIAQDLDAADGPSPFDELLSKPAQTENADSDDAGINEQEAVGFAADDAFVLPDDNGDGPVMDKEVVLDSMFDDETPASGAAANPFAGATTETDFGVADFGVAETGGAEIGDQDFANPNLSAAPSIAPISEPATAHPLATDNLVVGTAPILTTDLTPGKPSGGSAPQKGLPLVPLLLAGVALLGLAGAGWWVFGRPAPEPEPEPIVVPVKRPVVAQNPPLQAPAKPGIAPVAPPDSAAPGIAPAGAPKPKVIVKPAAPNAVPPQIQAQLKKLWTEGANAKHRGEAAAKRGDAATAKTNYVAARAAWTKALQLRPGHPGFQEAIAKLPK